MIKPTLVCFLMIFNIFIVNYSTHAAEVTPLKESIQWQSLSDTVFKKAKDQNKLILIFAKSEACHWCRQMEDTNFQDSSVISIINENFIPVKLDIDTNLEMTKQYKIMSLPTIVIEDDTHKIIKVIEGYLPVEKMIEVLNEIKKK